ncbi:hypothetical protein DRF65_27210 [Chryseobacterium pennae]|uniref:Uncharacterized protein n=1 Tax=Chryseobacterium pennae TaxID=2258962 RepID=A0A3D9C040_9FLAO|nr:hypothetical protein [Chryseobacterium pennae]REC59220.1 hypothetical protein DRF65_27210 [Chryseobacterium pennae]
MKINFSIVLISVFTTSTFGQVGIGTTTPASSSVLDIVSTNKGVLIPRVALISLDSKLPLSGSIPDGLLVFNTEKAGTGINTVIPGVYVWINNKWNFPGEVGRTQSKAVQYTNDASSLTNFNPSFVSTPLNIDIFGTEVFNDDNAIFEKINANQLRIKKAGLYLVSLNLALKQNPAIKNSRLSDYIYFNLDNTLASSKIVTLVPQYDPTKVNIEGRFTFGSNSYINAKDGQILTLNSQRYKDGVNYNGIVNYDDVSLSSVTIIKLQ